MAGNSEIVTEEQQDKVRAIAECQVLCLIPQLLNARERGSAVETQQLWDELAKAAAIMTLLTNFTLS